MFGKTSKALALAGAFVSLASAGAWAQDPVDCAGCVNTPDIADGAVTGNKLGQGSILTGKYADQSVTGNKLANGSILTGKFADGSVTGNKIAQGAILAGKLANGAVRTGKILNGAVTNAKIADGAVTNAKLGADVEQRISAVEAGGGQGSVPFFITLDTAAGTSVEQTIATNGPLEYFARCTVDDAGAMDRIEIIATSTATTWFEEGTASSPPRVPNEEVVGMTRDEPTGTALYEDFGHGSSAVADDGSFLAIIRFGMGLNLFGHDCLVVGTAELINGTL